ncbi:MAG: bifunctional (p)ppGpp synthetase/guanosine-3',5'-bis(diphosphate) 3'-pyrophosphohydrolase, partial [Deltaproteobacteria bacterium]|jgi:GTP pyrophosphokinase|nr:bifunctional (p)ppGpp synthetase/guanosine-3',5'-bis(diphosphate) 3'-pyrophosphohydrolase [Deltaproteobacteria bacterium]MBW2537684.1 bifunctional (p)ppGpp synthetase/guanosine-3',5'-bis(diphosphate) 3'-pyrophosphohydrolase [Deltaproteobacteria bacterium]
MSAEGQERIALETMEIYAPLANRLGLARFKSELQDLSFKYLSPQAYEEVEQLVADHRTAERTHIDQVCRQLTSKLAAQGFAARVNGRAKHLYSVWTKMQDRQCEYEQVHDRVAFEVVVESVADCYAALGVIHSLWTPVPGRFKDYVALPKPNMYQSLHTTVFGPSHQRVELAIRTHEMQRVAEQGVVAHWKFKESISGGIDPEDARRFSWLRQLMHSQTELKDPAEFLESVKVDLFQDEVYVFTPKGDVRAFPRGATPIDFAYAIHTEIGNHCSGARVNSSVVPLNYKLHNGDLVEVMTNPNGHPYKEWLEYVVTSRARSEIRRYLRALQRKKSLKLGHELLERAMQDGGLSLARLERSDEELGKVLGRFGVHRLEDLFVNIGYGKVKAQQVVAVLAPAHGQPGGGAPPRSIKQGRIEAFVRRVTGRQSHGILLNGVDDVLVRYTKCCNPLPGDEIVGFMTRGRGITVHRRECGHAFEADPQRRVDVSWDPDAKINRPVKLTVTTANRPGILATVGQTFHGQGINITEATCRATDDGRATNTFTFLCSDLSQLKEVMRHLQRIEGVIGVERV